MGKFIVLVWWIDFWGETFLPSKTGGQSFQNPFYIMGSSYTQKGHPFWFIMSLCPFGSTPSHAQWTHPNNELLLTPTCHHKHTYLHKHHLFCLCWLALQHVVSIHLQFFVASPHIMCFFSTRLLARFFDSRRQFNIVPNGSIAKFMARKGGGMVAIETLKGKGKMVGMPTPSDTWGWI